MENASSQSMAICAECRKPLKWDPHGGYYLPCSEASCKSKDDKTAFCTECKGELSERQGIGGGFWPCECADEIWAKCSGCGKSLEYDLFIMRWENCKCGCMDAPVCTECQTPLEPTIDGRGWVFTCDCTDDDWDGEDEYWDDEDEDWDGDGDVLCA